MAAIGRRTLGFLFADLRGYTRFIDEHGDAAAAKLVGEYRSVVREMVGRYGGSEQSTEGDSFFVVFDSVSAAVLCGIDILAATASNKPPIRLGVGVHAGEAEGGDSGFVAGAVNLAARLCAAAKAGDLLTTDTVRVLTRSAVEARFQSVGTKRLKGFEEPVPLWRIEVPGAARAPDDDRPPRFLTWPVLGGLLVGIAALAGDIYGISQPSTDRWFLALFPAAPVILIVDIVVVYAVVARVPVTSLIAGRALALAGLVVALVTPCGIIGVISASRAGGLAGPLIGLFGAALTGMSLAMIYGLMRRRTWAVGIAYVVCAILMVTAYGLQPVAVAGAWAITRRRENSLY